MKIDLLEAKSKFGEVLELEMATKISEDCFDKNLCKPIDLCTLHISYSYREDGVWLKGKGKLPLEYYCVKCAEPFNDTLEFEFEELFQNECEKDEETESNYFFNQDVLILDKCLRDTIILATPQNLKCREDCKGICPYCYANLNETQCDCEEKQKRLSNPFSELQGL